MGARNTPWTATVAASITLAAIAWPPGRPGSAMWQDAEKKKEAGPILEFRVVADRKIDAEAAAKVLAPDALRSPPRGYRWAIVAESSGIVDDGSAILIDDPAEGEKPTRKGVLLRLDRQNVTEADVRSVREARDDRGMPEVEVRFHPSGGRRFGVLTREHLPDAEGLRRFRLAIVVDGSVVSAPAIRSEIRDAARISGLKPGEVGPLVDRLKKAAPDAKARDDALKAFDDARFGLSIRWGLSGPETDPAKRASAFKGESFDADAWVKVAKDSGARFLAFSAKGPDGFALFETRRSGFDAAESSPFAKDAVKLLAEACRKGNLPLYLTYSIPPASDQAATCREQIRELATGYGDFAGFLLEDAEPGDALKAARTILREAQPSALIGVDRGEALDGEVRTRSLDPARVGPAPGGVATLVRTPIEASAGLKSMSDLAQAIVEAAGRGSDLAIEVSAAPDGSIPKAIVERLAEVGRWLGQFGESVYGTRPGPVAPAPWGVSTIKGDVVYLHVLRPAPTISFPSLVSPEIKGASLFGSRSIDGFGFQNRPAGGSADALLTLPDAARAPIDTIVVLNPPPPPKKAAEPKKKAETATKDAPKGE